MHPLSQKAVLISFILACAASTGEALAEVAGTEGSGVYIVLSADITDAKNDFMDGLWPIVRDALVLERETFGSIKREDRSNGELHVVIGEATGAARAWEVAGEAVANAPKFPGVASSNLEVEVQGSRLVVSFDAESDTAISDYLTNEAVAALGARLGAFQLKHSSVSALDDGVVRFLGFDAITLENLIELFETQGDLVVRPVIGQTEDGSFDAGRGNEVLPVLGEPEAYLIVENRDILTNDDFVSFESTFDLNGYPAISFRLNPEGAEALDVYTKGAIGGTAAIILDGKVVSTMRNVVRIPADEGLIEGRFDPEYALTLAGILALGALPVRLEVVQYREISPPLALPR